MEVYGTLLPYVENVGTTGATPAGSVSQTTMLANSSYLGINHERRFRMTSGTSHLGFRGFMPLAGEDFKLIWQVESPAPIDGEGPSNWANRNSHVGFSGGWGTLVYGNWDTPMRWVTVTSVNPIKGGYTGDMTPIIGSPGHQIPAWNSDQTFTALFEIPPNRAGFFRHEANSVQYWSPTLAGFSARLMFAANEQRTTEVPGVVGVNPFLVSGYVGYDNDWLRLRYAAEVHSDYFGTGNMGVTPGTPQHPSSMDVGHLALASVKINAHTDYETRIVATGDLLSYNTDDATPLGAGMVNEFSRAAVYALIQQSFGSENVWLAYGQATEGACTVTAPGNPPCTTTGLGASYYTLGYLHEFTETAGIYALGYFLQNDVSARYSPFPLLGRDSNSDPSLPNLGVISAGADSLGIGVGFVYSFSAKLLGGGDEKAAANAAKAPEGKDEAEDAEQGKSPAENAASPEGQPAGEQADESGGDAAGGGTSGESAAEDGASGDPAASEAPADEE